MSHRSRPGKAGLHVHCESCYSRRCRARVEVTVSCAVVPCRLLCGAVFHLCKEEEHLLLCPNVRVPCLNVEYGCQMTMTRSVQAAHLQACPASVVCCSMEWNRWPTEDAHDHTNAELHENLLKEDGGRGVSLDLAMALSDQGQLFHSLKMKKLFPELIQSVDEQDNAEAKRKEKEDAATDCYTWEPKSWNRMCPVGEKANEMEDEIEEEPDLTQEEREALDVTSQLNSEQLENYNVWERMFSMEMGGCREASRTPGNKGRKSTGNRSGMGTVGEEVTETGTAATAPNTHTASCKQGSSSGFSNSSSSSSSCLTSKSRKNFVYEHVEPMKIITVRTFKIPTSFAARHSRIRNPGFHKRESRGVDTSDLGVDMRDMPVWEEVQASLLCSLEREQRGHLIAEAMICDTLFQDKGTQTYNFLSAPFGNAASLADLTADKPLELHLQLQVEGVTSRHHKASSAFTFLCGHNFQRREYGKHFSNVHNDIQMSVNGWFEQRCPLAYLGCTYSRRRFQPSTHQAEVTYNQELGSFTLRPTVPVSLEDGSMAMEALVWSIRERGGAHSLSALPYEVLCHLASFLDSLSLSQLALVSRLMRDVCSSLLQDRGMVTLRWEKKTYSHGGTTWRAKQRVWQFSTLFSAVDRWCFRDAPSVSEHLKACPFYQRETRSEKFLLPRFSGESQMKAPCNGPSLVRLFQQNITT